MDALFTVANSLNLSAHFVRNVLFVRVLSLMGALILALFALSRPEPWMHAVYWNLIYATVNAVKLWRLRQGAA